MVTPLRSITMTSRLVCQDVHGEWDPYPVEVNVSTTN